MSQDVKQFLHSKGIATSRTTAYNPQGNGQIERENGIIWKTIQLAVKSNGLQISQWELVLSDALHSIRSLLCTSTNETPHERMFMHSRRSSNGQSLPTWLSNPGVILMKRHNRCNKYEPLVEQVDLLEANPDYSYVRLADGRETTVSNRYLAPKGNNGHTVQDKVDLAEENVNTENTECKHDPKPSCCGQTPLLPPLENNTEVDCTSQEQTSPNVTQDVAREDPVRRSSRIRRTPTYLDNYECF